AGEVSRRWNWVICTCICGFSKNGIRFCSITFAINQQKLTSGIFTKHAAALQNTLAGGQNNFISNYWLYLCADKQVVGNKLYAFMLYGHFNYSFRARLSKAALMPSTIAFAVAAFFCSASSSLFTGSSCSMFSKSAASSSTLLRY